MSNFRENLGLAGILSLPFVVLGLGLVLSLENQACASQQKQSKACEISEKLYLFENALMVILVMGLFIGALCLGRPFSAEDLRAQMPFQNHLSDEENRDANPEDGSSDPFLV